MVGSIKENSMPTQINQQEKPKKRQFGICKGKGSFVIKDDFEMTEEELVNQDDKQIKGEYPC